MLPTESFLKDQGAQEYDVEIEQELLMWTLTLM